jgi:hypothetical protein
MPEIDVEEKVCPSFGRALGVQPITAPVLGAECSHAFQGIEQLVALNRGQGSP